MWQRYAPIKILIIDGKMVIAHFKTSFHYVKEEKKKREITDFQTIDKNQILNNCSNL